MSGNDLSDTDGQTLHVLKSLILKLNLRTIGLSDCNMNLTDEFDIQTVTDFASAIKGI
jgi:hypothetical protein